MWLNFASIMMVITGYQYLVYFILRTLYNYILVLCNTIFHSFKSRSQYNIIIPYFVYEGQEQERCTA